MTGLRPLREHQTRAMDLLRQSFATGHKRPVLQLSTGAGKTVIAAHMVDGARSKRKRVAFCVPSISLVDQTFERFVENGIDPNAMGVIQADHPWKRPDAPIQIATAQTLARRDLPETDFVIVDEAHIQHKVYHHWMDDCPSLPFVGLTATPWAVGMGRHWDDLLKPTDMKALQDLGWLSQFRVYAPSKPDLSGVRTRAGDYVEADLWEIMDDVALTADIVSTWLDKGRGRPTLCFCVNRAHARNVHDRFQDAGVSVAYVDANTPREERDEIGKALARGDVEIVCNIGCLTTGIDWDVRCLILARPTKSEMLFVQIIGRALRPADGKDYALILDHSNSTLNLGLVTEIDFADLDMGREASKSSKRKERTDPLPKECSECGCLVPPLARACPACGHENKRVFLEAAGELIELDASGQPSRAGAPVLQLLRGYPKEIVYGQLECIRLERGWSSGWTKHKFRSIYGVWPVSKFQVAPVEPSALLRSWVKSELIRYAKANGSKVRHAA